MHTALLRGRRHLLLRPLETSPPLNVGNVDQVKSGGLGLTNLVADNICLGADCRAQWPAGAALHYIYFYFSTKTYNGNIGGLTGANSKCASDKPAGVPDGLTYAAYLCDNNTCQKPSADSNTLIVGAWSPMAVPPYYVLVRPQINYRIDYVPTFIDLAQTVNLLRGGISEIGGLPSTNPAFGPFNSIYPLVGDPPKDSKGSTTFWTGSGGGAGTQYLNAQGQYVYDFLPGVTSVATCNNWKDSSLTASGMSGEAGLFTNYHSWSLLSSSPCSLTSAILCYAK